MEERYQPKSTSDRQELMKQTGKSYTEVYEMSNADINDQLTSLKNEHGADVADIVKIGKNGKTAHRDDGKFLSKYELAQIQEHQDLIRTNIKGRAESSAKYEKMIVEAGASVIEDEAVTQELVVGRLALIRNRLSALKAAIAIKTGNVLSGNSAENFRKKMYEGADKAEKRGNRLGYAGRRALGAVGLFGAGLVAYRVAAISGHEIGNLFDIDSAQAAVSGGSGGAAYDPDSVPQNHTVGNRNADLDYLNNEGHHRGRMSTEGLFDGTERTSKEIDAHVLEKVKNNPSLMASVLEVRESGHMDKNFSLDEVNDMTHKSAVGGHNGEYSEFGKKQIDTLEKSWSNGEQGKLLSDKQVKNLLEKYDFINHGTSEGQYENALDDKTFSAGVFDYHPERGDQIYAKELGNGRVVFFKVNEQDASRDCLNIQTLVEKSHSQPSSKLPIPESTPDKPGAEGKIDEPQPQDEGKLGDPEGQLPPEKTETGKQPTTPTTTKNPEQPPHLQPKDPSKDINANPELNPQVQVGDDRVPAGPQETAPGSRPPETYTPPAQPVETPTTPRTDVPPVESNPSTGGDANGSTGINNAPKNPTTGQIEQQSPGSV